MKKELVIIFVLGLFLFSIIGFALADNEGNQSDENNYSKGLIVPDKVKAYWIAEGNCSSIGEVSKNGTYNENSKTWWFDITPFEEIEGCNPACVVYLSDETAEINWRCTGLGCRNDSDCKKNEICAKGGQCINVKKVLTQAQIQNIIRTRNRLRIHANQSECPENCTCSGSTTKCQFQNGTRTMTVHAGSSGNIIVQVKNTNASTQVQLYKSEDEKVYGVFRNNETKEIIMPDEVRERIIERKQKRWEEHNITLDEDGYYRVQSKKKARLFWIIPVKEKVRTRLNAETGEIIRMRTSWWGFLARDIRSEE